MDNDQELAAQLENDGAVDLTEISNQIDDEQIKQSFQTLDAQKRHWREKYKKLNESHQKMEVEFEQSKKVASAQSAKPDPIIDTSLLEAKVDLRMSGYSNDEISYMSALAKGQGKSLTDTSKDPFVLAGIEGMRVKAKAEQATPSASAKIGALGKEQSVPFSALKQGEQRQAWTAILDKQSAKSSKRESE